MKLTLLEQIKRMGQALKNYTDTAISEVTKATLGLGNVENKASATIRGELTSDDVVNALGFTPSKIDYGTELPSTGIENAVFILLDTL